MIPVWMDIGLVLAVILAATVYLVMRKIRSVRKLSRDWTTGRAEACDSCPVIKIREAQGKKTSS